MKRISLLMALLLTSTVLWGQDKSSGKIAYNSVRKLNMKLQGMDEAMTKQIPKNIEVKYMLHFSPTAAVYKTVPKEADNSDVPEENNGVVFKVQTPNNTTYCNFEKSQKVESKSFAGKTFLVESDMKALPWKLSEETKEILGYQCTKAVLEASEERKSAIVAWFTDQIPVSVGPEMLGGLPGAALELSLNNGDNVITATGITFGPAEEAQIKAPTEGKKMTEQAYKRMVDDFIKEQGGSNGTVLKVIRN
jgi:GLPGLI family protein